MRPGIRTHRVLGVLAGAYQRTITSPSTQWSGTRPGGCDHFAGFNLYIDKTAYLLMDENCPWYALSLAGEHD